MFLQTPQLTHVAATHFTSVPITRTNWESRLPQAGRGSRNFRGAKLIEQDATFFPVHTFTGPGLYSIGTYGLNGGMAVIAANEARGMVAHVSLSEYFEGKSQRALRGMFENARFALRDAEVYVMLPEMEALDPTNISG